jgi:proton-dependent oligopeptide transporter, POT family
MSAQTEEADAQGKAPGVLSHPRGLYFLFTTEMWERFSYYGMRALLVRYMLYYLQFQPAQSSATYKWYTSLVYLTPLIGGFIADKFIGLRMSIIIGGVLMAMGQFMLTIESSTMFYLALALLIAGNGFFKPNISTMVGKMYKAGDVRRDGAFTIFYMGINLGAFLAPLVCGTLRETKGPHWAFGAAGVGMLLGLGVFMVGQNRVLADIEAAGNELKAAEKKKAEASKNELDPDEQKPPAEGIAKMVRTIAMPLIIGLALVIAVYYGIEVSKGHEKPTSLIMPIGFLGVFVWMTLTLNTIKGAAKDKSTVIFVLFLAAVLFWMAFEQAGNTLNIWAITHTDLHIGSWEYPAEYFQSVNAILIFVLGIPFASLWVYLAKTGKEPSTPMKMFVGLVLCGLSFVPMVLAAQSEDSTTTSVDLDALPSTVDVSKMNAGRLTYDPAAKKLTVRGVLPIFVVNDALTKASDPKYIGMVKQLEEKAADASEKKPVSFSIAPLPPGWKFTTDNKNVKVTATDAQADFVMTGTLDAPTKGNLIAAGAPSEFREPIRKLEKDSQRARVSSLWLILSYLIATLGELCLSPVGLSMVTKLAPGRVASLFMGVWLLASSVAQYAGGTLGEMWGEITPTKYFSLFVWICFIGSAVLFAAVRPLRKLMHEVH